MSVQTPSPELAVIDGIPRVSSLAIAEHFQKLHKDVLRKIHQLAKDCDPLFIERNFALNNYSDEIGRELPMYQLTRDGFTLLAMGFNGKKALAWKIKYIEAFNAMEKALAEKARSKPKALPTRPQRVATDGMQYWDKALDVHKTMCETSGHVMSMLERYLKMSRENFEQTRRLIEEIKR